MVRETILFILAAVSLCVRLVPRFICPVPSRVLVANNQKMGIVSCLILPHGAMTFDGNPNGGSPTTERVKVISELQKCDCNALFAAYSKAAEAVKATSPDVIVLNTPHGMCLSGAVGVYLNDRAKGNAEWNGQWTEFEVDVALDTVLSRKLLDHLQNDGISAEGVTAFTVCEMPLRWGEVIPLYFLQDITRAGVKVVIITNPVSKMEELSETSHMGRSIAKFLRALDQHVLYVSSGDLAHTHETDCQLSLYLPDPRWNLPSASDTALLFDLAVENWVKGVAFSAEHAKVPLKSPRGETSEMGWNCCKGSSTVAFQSY